MGTKCGTTSQGALLACLVLLCRSPPVQVLINEAILTFKHVARPPGAKVMTDKNMSQSRRAWNNWLLLIKSVMIWQRKQLCLDMFFPFGSFDFGQNLLPSNFLSFFFPFLLHVFLFPTFFLHLFPLCIKHQLKDLPLQLPSIPSFWRALLWCLSEVFFLSFELSYPPLSLPFLSSWDLGQCRVYLRGKPRIFHKASISVFHKAASHEPAAGCQTRPHNSSKHPDEAGADGSVWWVGKISGCQWAKKQQKRESGKWHFCPFLNSKHGQITVKLSSNLIIMGQFHACLLHW